MTDLPMHRRTDADLEAALRDLGTSLAWPSATAGPDAPDVAAIVRSRIEAAAVMPPARRRWSWRPARRALVLALIAVLAIAAVASAIGFELPGLRLIFGEPSLSPPPTLAPTAPPRSTAAAPSSAIGSPSPSVPAGSPGASMALGDPVDARRPRRGGRVPRAAGRRIRRSGRRTPPRSTGPGRAR